MNGVPFNIIEIVYKNCIYLFKSNLKYINIYKKKFQKFPRWHAK